TWPELVLKRMIRFAAENGYDQVAWTTGKTQAARYDLSKHVESIEYRKSGDTYQVTVWSEDGTRVWRATAATLQTIEATLGKELADKIANGEGHHTEGQPTQLAGFDLQIGGEGMKGFYDKILPATVNKLVKKFGAK